MIAPRLDPEARPRQPAERRRQPVGQPQGPAWDENRDYSVPWQSGLTGIAYNAKYTGEVSSFEELLTRPDLKGKISLLTRDERHDAVHAAHGRRRPRGLQPGRVGQGDLRASRTCVGSGQVRRFTGNDYIHDLNAGNMVACEAWSGDVIAHAVRQPGHQVGRARGGPGPLVGQHDGAEQGRPQGERREADELLLRARGGGHARRVGELHLPGRRAPRRRWRRSTRRWSTTR